MSRARGQFSRMVLASVMALVLVALTPCGTSQAQTAGATTTGATRSATAKGLTGATDDTTHAGDTDGADPSALFAQAVEALSAERAVEAITKLEALADHGVVDAVVSYDRGLAYAARIRAGAEHPGDLGRAAHGFEEARELTRDPALAADAALALTAVRAEVARRRARAGDPIELEHGVSLGRSIVRLLPENVWGMIAAACALVLSAGIVVRARATFKRIKVAATTTSSIAAGLLVVTGIIVHSARNIREHQRDAVVVVPSARLLDDKHVVVTSVAALPEAARVQLLAENADFARVAVSGTEGWLPTSAVLPLAK